MCRCVLCDPTLLWFYLPVLPCLLFEDEHLLVVSKPAGLNTHAPHPYAGEGLYDWLRHREARWATLAIIHRLDKETSGVIIFSKSRLANRSLTEQFTRRELHKKYVLLTDRKVARQEFTLRSSLIRSGERYRSRPLRSAAELTETHFRLLGEAVPAFAHEGSALARTASLTAVEVEPRTGRTPQIRVHAAESGFPVLGDTLYGGTAAARVFLHASALALNHPATGERLTFEAPANFEADARQELRDALVDAESTDSYRVLHGASDGWPGWYVERLGPYLFSQSETPLGEAQRAELGRMTERFAARGAYHKLLTRHLRHTTVAEACPRLVFGTAAPDRFTIRENGLQFELSFTEGYSMGLFLDQRDNRRRLLIAHVAAGFPLFQPGNELRGVEVLNAFAYTCGFSICAAKGGARTTSLDLSPKYLEWGKRNFERNDLSPGDHDFIYGDVFAWLRRFEKKRRSFDIVLLDPPTFSQSKESGVFRAEKDYSKLVAAVLPLLRPGGILFASTNAANWPPEDFLAAVEGSARAAGRKVLNRHYAPQPPDFPISRAAPAYLKAVWLRLG